MGRPSDYSQEVADTICDRLAGGESLRAICADDDLPSASTVFRWLANPNQHAFREQYARAREAQMEAMAEDILAIADTPQEGVRQEQSDDGFKVVKEDMLGHRRLQVDARKWLMSKLAPKKYGDKITAEHTGANGGPIQTEDVTAERELFERRIAGLAARIGSDGAPPKPL